MRSSRDLIFVHQEEERAVSLAMPTCAQHRPATIEQSHQPHLERAHAHNARSVAVSVAGPGLGRGASAGTGPSAGAGAGPRAGAGVRAGAGAGPGKVNARACPAEGHGSPNTTRQARHSPLRATRRIGAEREDFSCPGAPARPTHLLAWGSVHGDSCAQR
jgi:hypothetical protein